MYNATADSGTIGCPPGLRGDTLLLAEMRDAFAQLDQKPLRNVLLESLAAETESLQAILRGFSGFLEAIQPSEIRRRFFASWQKTNNSAMSVEGLANRMTAEAEAMVGHAEPATNALALFRAAGRLNRVADEDLGVGGQQIHFELFYRMATTFCDQDDLWQSRQYCVPAALEFKTWLDETRLRSPIIVGLYTLLAHEGYTHAELETIVMPFRIWAMTHMGLSEHQARRALAWITVHNGGTEKAHFAHSCASMAQYIKGSGAEIDLQVADATFRKYFRLKGAVMGQLSEAYSQGLR
jgi:hypothetical protein